MLKSDKRSVKMLDVERGSVSDSEKETRSPSTVNSDNSDSSSPNKCQQFGQLEESDKCVATYAVTDSDDGDEEGSEGEENYSLDREDNLTTQYLLTKANATGASPVESEQLLVGLTGDELASGTDSPTHQAAQARFVALLEAAAHRTAAGCQGRTLDETCGNGDLLLRRLLDEGHSLHEATEEGESLLSLACSAGYYDLAQVLLMMRASVEDRGFKDDCTPLMEAASAGHVEIVKLLLTHKADVNAQSKSGNTPLMFACSAGHTDVVRVLLDAKANVEDHNENGHTPLMEAASAGNVQIAKLLLEKGAGINTSSNEFKESALTLACYKGHLEMVEFLLAAGADQEHKTDEMHTALMEACMDGHVEVARLLLDHGAQVNMPSDSFESPLTLAACGGHVVLAHLLLTRGANIEEVNDEGYTPLMEAAREGHEDMVRLLLKLKIKEKNCKKSPESELPPLPGNVPAAKVNVLTEETQETALTLACCGGFREVAQVLVSQGADLELGTSTPLMEASQEGHRDLVEFLLSKGACVNAQSSTGDTALTYACENGHTNVVDVLLQAGADIEHQSEGGRTPLMKACRAGHYCTVQYLLQQGAIVNKATTDNDHTPLSLACAGGHVKIVQLLLSCGANPSHLLKDKTTMIMEASKGGHTDVVRVLLEYPTNVELHGVPQPHRVVAGSLQGLQATQEFVSPHLGMTCGDGCIANTAQNNNCLAPTCHHPAPPPPTALTANKAATFAGACPAKTSVPACPSTVSNATRPKKKLFNTSNQSNQIFAQAPPQLMENKEGRNDQLSSSSEPMTGNRGQQFLLQQQVLYDEQVSLDETGESSSSSSGDSVSSIPSVVADCVAVPGSVQYPTSSPLHSLATLATHTVETQTAGSFLPTGHNWMVVPSVVSSPTLPGSAAVVDSSTHLTSFPHPVGLGDAVLPTNAALAAAAYNVQQPHTLPLSPASTITLASLPASTVASVASCHQEHQFVMTSTVHSMPPQYTTTTTVPVSERKIMVPSKKADRNKQLKQQMLQQQLQLEQQQQQLMTQQHSPSQQDVSQIVANTTAVSSAKTANTIYLPVSAGAKPRTDNNKRSVPIDCDCGHAHAANPLAGVGNSGLFGDDGALLQQQTIIPGTGVLQQASSAQIPSGAFISASSSLTTNNLVPVSCAVAAAGTKTEMRHFLIHPQLAKTGPPAVNLPTSTASARPFTSVLGLQQPILTNTLPAPQTNLPTSLQAGAQVSPSCLPTPVQTGPVASYVPTVAQHQTFAAASAPAVSGFQVLSQPFTQAVQGNKKGKKQPRNSSKHERETRQQQQIIQQQQIHQHIIQQQQQQQQQQLMHHHHHEQEQQLQQQLQLQHQLHAAQVLAGNQPLDVGAGQGVVSAGHLVYTSTLSSVTALSHEGAGGGAHCGNTACSLGMMLPHKVPATAYMHTVAAGNLTDSTLLVAAPATPATVIGSHSPQMAHDLITSQMALDSSLVEQQLTLDELAHLQQQSPGLAVGTTGEFLTTDGRAAAAEYLTAVGGDTYRPTLGESPCASTDYCSTQYAAVAPPTASTAAPSAAPPPPPPQITNPVEVDAVTEGNRDTALTLACAGGHDDLVRLLLSRGANIEHRDKKGFTPLILAATAGHVKVVETLLAHGANIEAQSERTKDTPLSLACSGGRFEVVELLLKRSSNKEHRNVSDYTPLSLAASGGYVNIIKLLLEHNAEINSRTGSKLGISPLMLAAMNGHTAAVKMLLDSGSDINAQIETNRNTALTLACFQGRHEVVSLLLDRKANVEHRAKTGLTPLMEAASGGYVDVGEVLLNKGADVNALPVPSSRDTALTIAADKGHFKFVKLLIERGASVEVKNKKGNSAMWLAANGGHFDVVELLYNAGADIDSADNRSVSCLMAAFRRGHLKVVRFMVRHVTQFPSDEEVERFIKAISTDQELLKKCRSCYEVIRAAKDKQAQEASKIADQLLKEVEMEATREKSKKEAANRRKQKRKAKRLEKKEEQRRKQMIEAANEGDEEVEAEEEDDGDEYEDIHEPSPPPPPHPPQPQKSKASASNASKKTSKKDLKKNNKKNLRNATSIPQTVNNAICKLENVGNVKDKTVKEKSPPAGVAKSNAASDKVVLDGVEGSAGRRVVARDDCLRTSHEERDSGIDSNSQTSATSDTKGPAVVDKDKAKKKKKRKDTSCGSNGSKTKRYSSVIPLRTAGELMETLAIGLTNVRLNEGLKQTNEKSENKNTTQQPKKDTKLMASASTPAAAAPRTFALNTTNKRRDDVAASSVKSSIKELDTFNDIVPPFTSTLTPTLSNSSSMTVRSNTSAGFQDSVASLDTFGEVTPMVPLVGLTVTSGPMEALTLSPKKPAGRGHDGWKEVNRKSKKVSVNNAAISRIIGRAGCNINAIREASGAHIEVEKQGKSQGDRLVIIRGSTEATRKATSLISALVKDPDTDISDIIPKTVINKSISKSNAKMSAAAQAADTTQKKSSYNQTTTTTASAPIVSSNTKSIIKVAHTGNSWAVPPSVVSSSASPKRGTGSVIGALQKGTLPTVTSRIPMETQNTGVQLSLSSNIGYSAAIVTTAISSMVSTTRVPPLPIGSHIAGVAKSPAARQLFSVSDKVSVPGVPGLMFEHHRKPLADVPSPAAQLGPVGSQRPCNTTGAKSTPPSSTIKLSQPKEQSLLVPPLLISSSAEHGGVSAPPLGSALAGIQPPHCFPSPQLQVFSDQHDTSSATRLMSDQQPSLPAPDAANRQLTATAVATLTGSSAPDISQAFALFGPPPLNQHQDVSWGNKEIPPCSVSTPLGLADASKAPGYRAAPSLSTATSSSSNGSSASLARSAPGTPVASQNLRAIGLNNNRQAAVTPPPTPSARPDVSVGLQYSLISSSRTPPPTFATTPLRMMTHTLPQPVFTRSYTPPATMAMPQFLARRSPVTVPSSLAPGGPSSIRPDVGVPVRPLRAHEPQPAQNQPGPPPAAGTAVPNLDLTLMQFDQQSQLQNFSSYSLSGLINGPQFTTPQTNTQPVFSSNINSSISTHQIQSNLNPNAPDFSSRSSFVSPTYSPRSQINFAQFQPSANVHPMCPSGFGGLGVNALDNSNAAAAGVPYNASFDLASFLKTGVNISSLQQSPHASSPGSPTATVSNAAVSHQAPPPPPLPQQPQVQFEERQVKLRPIGTERAQKRTVVAAGVPAGLPGATVLLPSSAPLSVAAAIPVQSVVPGAQLGAASGQDVWNNQMMISPDDLTNMNAYMRSSVESELQAANFRSTAQMWQWPQ